MAEPTLRDYWFAANDIREAGNGIPLQNIPSAEATPLHPFALYSPYEWYSGNNAVELKDHDTYWNESGGLFLAVKPSYRVVLRIESNANNEFNGITEWADNHPVQGDAGGVIDHNGNIGATDRWMEVALAKGDFLFINIDGDHTIPEYISKQTNNEDQFMLGINDSNFDFLNIFSVEDIDTNIRVELVDVQYIEGEEGMFLEPELGQGESGNLDTNTGTVQPTQPSPTEKQSGMVEITQPVNEQLNYRVQILGEPTLIDNEWKYQYWVLINGEKKDGAYDDWARAREQAESRWADRPPIIDTTDPTHDDYDKPMDWEGLILAGLLIGGLVFGLWFTIKAVGKNE